MLLWSNVCLSVVSAVLLSQVVRALPLSLHSGSRSLSLSKPLETRSKPPPPYPTPTRHRRSHSFCLCLKKSPCFSRFSCTHTPRETLSCFHVLCIFVFCFFPAFFAVTKACTPPPPPLPVSTFLAPPKNAKSAAMPLAASDPRAPYCLCGSGACRRSRGANFCASVGYSSWLGLGGRKHRPPARSWA